MTDPDLLRDFVQFMNIAQRSTVTIGKRLELITRLRTFLDGKQLLEATTEDLTAFQATFAHLAPASANIYTRHILALYNWAQRTGKLTVDPTDGLAVPNAPRGLPHPMGLEDLRSVFALTHGPLRVAYLLAAFAGLRAAEICRLRWEYVTPTGTSPRALVHGKGRRERKVPLFPPVMDELTRLGIQRSGPMLFMANGKPYEPNRLSIDSHYHLQSLGIPSTLHSCRHFYATMVAELTHDPLLVRDLLGHQSVTTSEIYIKTTLSGVQGRLEQFSELMSDLLGDVAA